MQRLILAAALLTTPAAAQTADADGTALVRQFDRFCLQGFPEPRRIEDAGHGELTTMPKGEVARYLHDDPGRGWRLHAGGADYVLTVEDPPYHTCAVRRVFATAPQYAAAWQGLVNRWAAAGHGPMRTLPAQTLRREDYTLDGNTMVANDGRGDVLMDIRTRYDDGRVEQRFARRAMHPGDTP